MSRQGFDASDTNSASSMIMKIIENKIFALVHTAFLAEVTSVTKNKVDVKMLKRSVFAGKPEPAQEVKGLLVGFPGVKKWSLTMPISIGDIGLAIICQDDISGYKSAGMGGVPPTTRRFAVHDSIFIPLSMYLQPDITEDFIIKSTDDKTVITLKKEGEVTVTGTKIDVILEGESNISAKKDIKVTTDANITAKCKDLSVDAKSISLGTGTLEPLVKASFLTAFDAHTHTTSSPGAPTGVPILPKPSAQKTTITEGS